MNSVAAVLAYYSHLWHAPVLHDQFGTMWVQARGVVYGIAHIPHHPRVAYVQIWGMRNPSEKIWR